MKEIAKKMLQVTNAIEPMEKAGHNAFNNYKYLSDEQIIKTCREAMIEAGIQMTTSVKSATIVEAVTKMTRVAIVVEFIDTESGERIVVEGFGDGADKGDKGIYKAITGAVKYVLIKNFLLPTGDDPEASGSTDKSSNLDRAEQTIRDEMSKNRTLEPKEEFPEDIKNWFLMQWTNSPDTMLAICNTNELKPVSKHEMENYQKWVAANAVKCPDKLISIYKATQNEK